MGQFRSLSVVEGQLSILIFYRNTRFLSLETLGQKTIFSFQEATASAGLSSVQLSMMLNFLLYLKVAAYPKVVVSFLLCIKIFLIKRILLCPRAGRAISKNESRRTDPTSLNFCSEKFQLWNLYFFRIRMERLVFCWGILWLEAFVLVEGFSFITADVSQFRSLSVVEGQLSILILYRHTRFLSLESCRYNLSSKIRIFISLESGLKGWFFIWEILLSFFW